jgi:hypothetical protein
MSSTAPVRSTGQPIVLIHGMWMTPLSWEHWANRYRERGHRVLAPPWPGLDGEPAEIRRDSSPLRGLSIPDVIDHHERIIRELDQPRSSSATPSAGCTRSSCSIAASAQRAPRSGPARRRACGGCRIRRFAPPGPRCTPVRHEQRRPAHPGAVPLVLHELAQPQGFGRRLRALLHPGFGASVLPGRLRQLQPERRDQGRLPEAEATAAPPGHGGRGPHLSALGQPGELQEAAPGTRCHGAQGVPRPLPLPGPGRLGGGRRLHPHLDDRARKPGSAEPGVNLRLTHIGGPTVLIQVAGWRLLTD